MTVERDQLLRRFAVGDVLRYSPSDGSHHCRQGTAIVYEDGVAIDTYWGLERWNQGRVLNEKELADADLLFKLGEFRCLGPHWEHKREEWLTYAPADRQRIGSQAQYQSTYFVRIGAEPDLQTQIDNAKAAVEDAMGQVRSAEWTLENRREDLAKLEASRVG